MEDPTRFKDPTLGVEELPEVPAKKTKRLTSVVWNHFERVKKADAQYAVCIHCQKKLSGSSNSGTTHLRNHLLRCLKRSNYDVSQILSAKRKRKETSQSPLRPCNMALTTISYEEGKLKDEILCPMPLKFEPEQQIEEVNQTINLGSIKFDQERSRLDIARMIMLHGYPLEMVDHVGFKVLVKNLQPMFDVNNNGSTESDCLILYRREKQKLYEAIRRLHCRISLSVDMWHSPENAEYICLTANYIDEDWRLQKTMLNFLSFEPSHTDDILSEAIIDSLTDWGIDRKLFSMTFDECSSSEIMVSRVKDWLFQNRPLLMRGELFDVRCIAHLLKSIVQEVMEACRDVINKVRETIRHVKSTKASLRKLNEIAQEVGITNVGALVLDSPLKWNSTYIMLASALEYRGAFFLLQNNPSDSKALSETEWECASSTAEFIKFILEFTNSIMGNRNPTANIYFSEICDMNIQLIEWCKSPDEFLSSVALKMKLKFDVYWGKCSLGLAIAAILDPRYKMKLVEYYFRQIYCSGAPDRIKEVSHGLRELFSDYSLGGISSPHQDSVTDLASSSNSSRDKLKGFDKFLYETCQSQSMCSDLDKYLEEPVFPRNCDFSVLNWWKVHTPRYPILSMMARDLFAVPVSTLGRDVAFSTGGRVLDRHHSLLSPETREALICGHDWLKMGAEGTSLPLSSSSLLHSVETS